uniref:NAD binding oxidoreductase n=1 Tax=uncultured Armatimonadetes bacterium TaxID=157466 RepID=A0A6J4J786_9BACT|nr:hypothetical protein AVDCRST_MAG63-3017 [uncultured Armatimonadetes bacterium]
MAPSPPPPVRFGILGAAAIAPRALIRPARAVPDVEVVAVAARDEKRARAFAAAHAVSAVHATYQALIDAPDIDAVYIPLPNALHAEWSVRALRAGKHVLCEKPLASNAAEAEQVAAVAAESGRILMEAVHYRYHPLALLMKEIVASGELGELRSIHASFCVPLFRRDDIRYRYHLAGGATMDLGCYVIHLIRFLSGAEPVVTAARALLVGPDVDRRMEAEFTLPASGTARMLCSLRSHTLLRIGAAVVGERGVLHVRNPFLPHFFHQCRVQTREGVRVEHVSLEPTYNYQLRAFVRAVRGEGPNLTDAADAVATMRVVDAVYERAGLKRRAAA